MKILSPKGPKLLDFSYVNLWIDEGQAKFVRGGTFVERLQFSGLKSFIKSCINKVKKALYQKRCFILNDIYQLFPNRKDNWDILLNTIIIKVVVKSSILVNATSDENLVNDILVFYYLEVQKNHEKSNDILTLINKKMELETIMDLMFSENCSQNSKGQFRSF